MSTHAVELVPRRGALIESDLSDHSDRRWSSFSVAVAVGWFALLAGCLAIGGLVTGPLADTPLVAWDRRYPVQLESARSAAGNMWSNYGSHMGETFVVVGVAVLVGVVLLIMKRWASVTLIAVAMLSEVSIFVLTTVVVPRPRPAVEQLDVSPPTSSFPSGHTAAATALALSLAVVIGWNFRSPVFRVSAWLVAVLIGPVVGFSRIYRGMHHPLDVIVGLALGLGCVLVAYLAVRAWVGAASSKDDRSQSKAHPTTDNSSVDDPADRLSDPRMAS